MNHKIFYQLIFCLALIMVACSEDESVLPKSPQIEEETDLSQTDENARKAATNLIKGIGFYAETGECDPSLGADYILKMTGALEGCLYAFIDYNNCWGEGLYFEKGREIFVGTYKGKSGTFETTYKFEAKFEACGENGFPAGAEIFGMCQHPIVEGSGTGVFAGVTGRLDFWDNVEVGNFPYFGYLKY